jgi:hypothetical protein
MTIPKKISFGLMGDARIISFISFPFVLYKLYNGSIIFDRKIRKKKYSKYKTN